MRIIFVRSDRDQFISINWDNIQGDKTHRAIARNNFGTRTTQEEKSYDFYSIMHWQPTALGKMGLGLKTIGESNLTELISKRNIFLLKYFQSH